MFSKLRRLWDVLVLVGGTLACGQIHREEPAPLLLQDKTMEFAKATRLTARGDGALSTGQRTGTFQAASYPVGTFRPSPFLVLPAGAAAFYQEKFAGAFEYQTFTFASSGCNAAVAFDRYFGAIEELSGKALDPAEKERIVQSFDMIFANVPSQDGQVSSCFLLDLISCIADFSIANAQTIQKQASQEPGNGQEAESFAAGANSCIGEVFGPGVLIGEMTETEEEE